MSNLREGRAMRRRKTEIVGEGLTNKYTESAVACYEASISLWWAVSFSGVQMFSEGGPEDWHERDIDRDLIGRAVEIALSALPMLRLLNRTVPNVSLYVRAYNAAVARCVALNMPMVHSVCSRFEKRATSGIAKEDLMQEGVMGLIRAIRKFQPAKGFQFSTYCFYWIYQCISRAAQDSHLIHTPLDSSRVKESLSEKALCARHMISINQSSGSDNGSTSHETEMSQYIASKEFASPEDVHAAHQDRRNLMSAMNSQLKSREMQILRLRFEDDLTLKEIGDIIGCTRERVRQIEFQALGKLRSYMDRDEANLPDLEQD